MKNSKNRVEENESNFLGKIIFRFLPYWPVFAILFLLAGVGSWLYLRFTTPLYESTARLLIKDEKKGTENTKGLEDLNLISTKKIIENEVEVIQSRPLLNEVVRNLHLYAPVYEEGNIRRSSAYVTSPISIEVQNTDKIQQVDKVEFDYDSKSAKVSLNKKPYSLNQWVVTPYGTLRFVPNKEYTRATNRKLYFSLLPTKAVAGDIQSRLEVKPTNKQASILNLVLKDEVPERGGDILNELLTTYNKTVIKDKNILAANTLAFVEERLRSVEHDLDSIERRTQQYKTRTGAIDVGEQGKLFLQNVSQNDQKLSQVNEQLAVLGQVKNYVQSKNSEAGIVPSTLGVSDPMLSQLVTKLYTAEQEYETMKKTTGEGLPSMVALSNQIDNMRPSILENIRSQEQSLLASRNNIYSTNGTYNSMLQSIPEKQRELVDISREQSIKNGIYAFLLQKREETALSYASTVSDSRIVDPAESSASPVSPKRKVVFISALLLAFFAGIGIVSAKESLSRNIMFRHEIEKLTDQPIIGEIVADDFKDPIVIGESNKTFIAEQFRRLRATLKYLGINSKNKRILVTSAISGEGKSFIATNLALSLALTGKRVVLMDCDLNNPSLNNKLRIHDEKGLTEYLLNESGPEEIIRGTDLNENLFLISAGYLPRNPSELLMNGRIEELLSYLDDVFDYIVIDTAPVSPVTDAYTLSPLCNATLFVIRHKYTPKVFVQRIDENNKINELHNMAIVFNGIQSRGFGSKKYGYGYGYGYIHKDKDERYQIGMGKS
jgi:capsular exopolysaccharide synthesis family protein